MGTKFNILCIKMKFQRIANLFDTTFDDKDIPRFVTKTWIEVYDQTGRNNYNVNKEIRIKTPMPRSDLCDFSDAYIVVEGSVSVNRRGNVNKRNISIAFKDNAAFINCISKINRIQIDNAEDLDVVMAMFNLLECSKNYRKTQAVRGIITEMNQVILFLLILSLSNTRQTLPEKHQIIKTYWKMLKSLCHENIQAIFGEA